MTGQDQCRIVEYLAMVPCAANNSLAVTRDESGEVKYDKCYVCEDAKPPLPLTLDDDRCQYVGQDAIASLSKLLSSKIFQSSQRPRVLGMIAVKRFATHFRSSDFIDLKVSPLGQWSLTSLHSSIRELRILGG